MTDPGKKKGSRTTEAIAPAMDDERGRVQVYTGAGKGKTTSSVGLCVRALGHGWKVALVQFDKGYDGEDEHYAERHVLRKIDGIDLFPTGCERMNEDGTFRFGAEEQDLAEAQRGLTIARDLIAKGEHRLIVLDEALSAVMVKMVTKEEVMELLRLQGENPVAELVLTGWNAWDELIEAADLVTEMRKVKHYYDDGLGARPGIEF
ncbi:MAG: cob(I)yrinic acid a,c-diamide adenosyltransferase [Planctomycetota bacterium]